MSESDLFGKDIISINDLSKEDILKILTTAKDLEENPRPDLMKGKILATMFYEPSTRTRLSFTSAMERMGGNVLGFEDESITSASKGETIWDTIKMIEQYSDIIVQRHRIEGAPRHSAMASSKPVINAGDGSNQHPTQTLIDLYTILKEKGTLDGLNVGFIGDLKYGRTVHSLCIAMSHFKTKMYFISPKALSMSKGYLDILDRKKIHYSEHQDLSEIIGDLDIIYMTRIQKERFPDPVEYNKLKGCFQIDLSTLDSARKDVRILHPLPRVDEIAQDLDDTPNAAYFRQAGNGVPVRQAIIALVSGVL